MSVCMNMLQIRYLLGIRFWMLQQVRCSNFEYSSRKKKKTRVRFDVGICKNRDRDL